MCWPEAYEKYRVATISRTLEIKQKAPTVLGEIQKFNFFRIKFTSRFFYLFIYFCRKAHRLWLEIHISLTSSPMLYGSNASTFDNMLCQLFSAKIFTPCLFTSETFTHPFPVIDTDPSSVNMGNYFLILDRYHDDIVMLDSVSNLCILMDRLSPRVTSSLWQCFWIPCIDFSDPIHPITLNFPLGFLGLKKFNIWQWRCGGCLFVCSFLFKRSNSSFTIYS